MCTSFQIESWMSYEALQYFCYKKIYIGGGNYFSKIYSNLCMFLLSCTVYVPAAVCTFSLDILLFHSFIYSLFCTRFDCKKTGQFIFEFTIFFGGCKNVLYSVYALVQTKGRCVVWTLDPVAVKDSVHCQNSEGGGELS
jgi:hypothetical protein